MNNEIKEILDYLKPKYDIVDEFGYGYKKVKFKDCKILLDYITNLQEENEMYAQLKYEYEDIIDKAKEYIKTHYLNANEPELENILNGGDKE